MSAVMLSAVRLEVTQGTSGTFVAVATWYPPGPVPDEAAVFVVAGEPKITMSEAVLDALEALVRDIGDVPTF